MDRYDLIYVDDEPTMIAIFQQAVGLKYRHWQAAAFVDSRDLLEKINQKKIAARVWIIDLMMPAVNGVDVARAIRASGDSESVLIAYTALDPQTLSRNPEYRDGLHLFARVIGKQEGFLKILAGLDAAYFRKTKAETHS